MSTDRFNKLRHCISASLQPRKVTGPNRRLSGPDTVLDVDIPTRLCMHSQDFFWRHTSGYACSSLSGSTMQKYKSGFTVKGGIQHTTPGNDTETPPYPSCVWTVSYSATPLHWRRNIYAQWRCRGCSVCTPSTTVTQKNYRCSLDTCQRRSKMHK